MSERGLICSHEGINPSLSHCIDASFLFINSSITLSIINTKKGVGHRLSSDTSFNKADSESNTFIAFRLINANIGVFFTFSSIHNDKPYSNLSQAIPGLTSPSKMSSIVQSHQATTTS